ncbi:transcription factor bHLH13-like [Canna indica]|uniref:Transcription factor bHLH13-like n=1 Tax=Canna indica TaxID=4628 RepID=A0AAQ3L0N9_9LILI|nr:transcription factor bHLH13-like [Canna indica]
MNINVCKTIKHVAFHIIILENNNCMKNQINTQDNDCTSDQGTTHNTWTHVREEAIPCTPLPPTNEMPQAEKGSTTSNSARRDVIQMERSRRDKMTEFYTTLQSMVPNLFPKATRTRIIDETVAHIKRLEEVIATLEAQKASAAAAAAGEASNAGAAAVDIQSGRSSEVEVSMAGDTAFFGIRFASRPGVVTKALEVFDKHKAEVLAAAVSCSDADGRVTVTVTASVGEKEVSNRIKEELMSI